MTVQFVLRARSPLLELMWLQLSCLQKLREVVRNLGEALNIRLTAVVIPAYSPKCRT